MPDISPITLAILGPMLILGIVLALKIRARANAIRDARHADASADTLMRAYGLKKPASTAERLAKLRASQRIADAAADLDKAIAAHKHRSTQLRAARLTNPGPGQRPHPVYSDPAFVIQPALDPVGMPSISTADTPDLPNATAIHTLSMPINATEQAGEFAGAGASGHWSDNSTPAGTTASTYGD